MYRVIMERAPLRGGVWWEVSGQDSRRKGSLKGAQGLAQGIKGWRRKRNDLMSMQDC